jgi:hypothetical protein
VNVIVYGKDNKKYPWNPDKFGEDEFNEKTFEKFMKALSESERCARAHFTNTRRQNQTTRQVGAGAEGQ